MQSLNKGTIYTSYFANLKSAIGIKISIARFNPKWLNPNLLDEWYFELAPKENLLLDYKNNKISKEEFIKKYNVYIRFQNKILKRVTDLVDKGYDVTLLCYEKPEDFCHRHLLAKILINMGYIVKEI